MKYLVGLIAVISIAVLFIIMEKPPTESQQVYRACMRAKIEYTIFNDNYCKALQDDYNLEFTCTDECKVTRRVR